MYATPEPTSPGPRPTRSLAGSVGIGAACAVAVAGIVAVIMLAFGGHAHANPTGGSTGSTGSNSSGQHSTPAPAANPAVATLQRELGQLNYYEGPVTGVLNSQTTQAITYLQRDAHLPQTGVMNAATQQALARFLATGNNQMGG